MAAVEKILNVVSGGIIPYEEKVSQKTYQYWRDVKEYRRIIKELESKGITRDQLRSKGLIIDYLLDESVKVETMGGKGGGGPSGIIPILGTPGGNNDSISNEVSDEEYNNLRERLEIIVLLNRYIPSDNHEQAIRILNELTGPEPTNTEERRRRRLILRGDVKELEIEKRIETAPQEAEMFDSNPDELISDLEADIARTRAERNQQIAEMSPQMPEHQIDYESYEREHARNERERQFYENERRRQQEEVENTHRYTVVEERQPLNIKMTKYQKSKITNQFNDLYSDKEKGNKKIAEENKPDVYQNYEDFYNEKYAREEQRLKNIKDIAAKKLLQPTEHFKFKVKQGSEANKATGLNINEATAKIQENIDRIGEEYQTDENIMDRVTQRLFLLKKLTNGINQIAYKNQPVDKIKRINKTNLHSLLMYLSGPKTNNQAIYLDYGGGRAINGRVYLSRGDLLNHIFNVEEIDVESGSGRMSQMILNVFSSYGINLNQFSIPFNSAVNKKILAEIKKLTPDEQLDLYNTIAYIIKRSLSPNSPNYRTIIIRNSLEDLTEYQRMRESENLNRQIRSQFQFDLLLTPEEINHIHSLFSQSNLSNQLLDRIAKINYDFAAELVTANERGDISEINDIKNIIVAKMIEELTALFQAVRDDLELPYFSKIEAMKFFNDLFSNKTELINASGLTLNNILQIPQVIRSLITVHDMGEIESNTVHDVQTPNVNNLEAGEIVLDTIGLSRYYSPAVRYRRESREVADALVGGENQNRILSFAGIHIFWGNLRSGVTNVMNRFRNNDDDTTPLYSIIDESAEVGQEFYDRINGVPISGSGGPPDGNNPNSQSLAEWLNSRSNLQIVGRHWRRNISIGGIIFLLSILGYGTYEIIDYIDKLAKGGKIEFPEKRSKPYERKKKEKQSEQYNYFKPPIFPEYAKNKAIEKVGKYIDNTLISIPDNIYSLLNKYGNNIIVDISVCRKPIDKLNKMLLHIATYGTLINKLKQYNYDDIFHLYMNIKLDNGLVFGVEKNEVVKIQIGGFYQNQTSVCKQVSNPPRIDLNTFWRNGEAKGGKNFYKYDFAVNNCQKFVNDLLTGNGINELKDFVLQKISEILSDKNIQNIGNKITDVAAIYNKVTGKD